MPQPSPLDLSQGSADSQQGRSRSRRVSRDRSRRFALGLVAAMAAVSLLLGWGLSSFSQAAPLSVQPAAQSAERLAQAPKPAEQQLEEEQSGDNFPRTVDYVPERYQIGQRLYLENCATCHIGVPPETLPSESWRNLIQDASHYGAEIQPPLDPSRGLIWSYLRAFSRQKSSSEERVPYRLARSRYFKALHPNVAFSAGVSLQSCATCHRAAQQFSFRPWEENGTQP